MKIVESVTNDITTNTKIEVTLDSIADKEERMVLLDMLDRIYDRKQITAGELKRDVSALHPDYAMMGNTMKRLFQLFPDLVTDEGDELIMWKGNTRSSDDTDVDTRSMEAQAATQQVQIVFTVVEEMAKLPSFTINDVKECLYDMGLATRMADMFADHVMQHFTNNSTRNSDGSLTLNRAIVKKAQDYINDWKNFK